MKTTMKHTLTHLTALLLAPLPASETPSERDARMAWWREARFGMFGPRSVRKLEYNGDC